MNTQIRYVYPKHLKCLNKNFIVKAWQWEGESIQEWGRFVALAGIIETSKLYTVITAYGHEEEMQKGDYLIEHHDRAVGGYSVITKEEFEKEFMIMDDKNYDHEFNLRLSMASKRIALGLKIERAMESTKIDKKTLASRLGLDQETIERWISGRVNLTLEKIASIEQALGINLLNDA